MHKSEKFVQSKRRREKRSHPNTKTILYLIFFLLIIAFISLYRHFTNKNDLPHAIKTTSLVISDSGKVLIEESLSIDKRVDMIICSRGIQSPNPILLLDFRINGQRISKDDIQIKSIHERGINVRYLKLKNPLLYYVNSTDKEIYVSWMYY